MEWYGNLLSILSLAVRLAAVLMGWCIFGPKGMARWRLPLLGVVYAAMIVAYSAIRLMYLEPHWNLFDAKGIVAAELFYYLANGVDYLLILISFCIVTKPRRLWELCGISAAAMILRYYTYSFADVLVPWYVSDIPEQVNLLILYILQAVFVVLIGAAFRRLRIRERIQRYQPIVYLLCCATVAVLTFGPLAMELILKYTVRLDQGDMMMLYPALVLVLMVTVMLAAVGVRHWQEYRQLKETQQHIEGLNAVLDDSKRSIHDFHKHIRHLQHLVAVHTQTGDIATLEREVDSYCRELLEHSEKEEMLLHLDDLTLRALLYGRRTQAKAANIAFILDASAELPHFPVKNYQLVEIVDNLMDNAFDCVAALSEERFIRVVLSCESIAPGVCRHTLCIQNPYDNIDMDRILSGMRFTSKAGDHQGIGLDKVGKLVRDTGGQLVLSHEDHIFTARVCYEA